MSEEVTTQEESGAEDLVTEGADDTDETQEEETPEEKSRPSRADRRIDQLTGKFRQEQRNNEALRAEVDQLKANQRPSEDKEVLEPLVRPKKKDFSEDSEYFEALADYTEDVEEDTARRLEYVETWRDEFETQNRNQDHARQQTSRREKAQGIMSAGKDLHTDFDDVAADVELPGEVLDTMFSMDEKDAAKLTYHFAQNPEEAENLALQTPTARAIRMGQMAGSTLRKRSTKSNPPAGEVGGGGEGETGRVTDEMLNEAAKGSVAQYRSLRARWTKQQG